MDLSPEPKAIDGFLEDRHCFTHCTGALLAVRSMNDLLYSRQSAEERRTAR